VTDTPADDHKDLDVLYAAVAPTIQEVVNDLLHQGVPFGTLGAVFERRLDGSIHGGVGTRAKLAEDVLADARFPEESRRVMVSGFAIAAADELPMLLLVELGDGEYAVGMKRHKGELVLDLRATKPLPNWS